MGPTPLIDDLKWENADIYEASSQNIFLMSLDSGVQMMNLPSKVFSVKFFKMFVTEDCW